MIQQDKNCALAITTAEQDTKDWDEAVKQVQSALNTIHSKSTIPMKALIGCETRGVAEARLLSEVQDIFQRLELDELREDVKMHIDRSQQEPKEQYDRSCRAAVRYQKGDLVRIMLIRQRAARSYTQSIEGHSEFGRY